MRLIQILVVLGALAPFANAISADSYLKLRAKQHIVQPTSSQALDSLLGTKIVEIQGVVQGSFKSGDVTSLMVRRDDGQTLIVDCSETPPSWLGDGEVATRLLVRATRNAEFDPLTVELLSCAPESEIKPIDAAYWKKEATKSAPIHHRAYTEGSRGEVLHGWIGGKPPRGHRDAFPPNEATPYYAAFVKKRNPRLSDAAANEIASAVIGYSLQYGVDARLVMAVIMAESDFDPTSTSHTGAMGLGQLMPSTAAWMGVSNAYDLTENIGGAIKLLSYHLNEYMQQTGDPAKAVQLALAAYNAGEGAVKRHGGIPPYRETQNYVVKVIEIYNQLSRKG